MGLVHEAVDLEVHAVVVARERFVEVLGLGAGELACDMEGAAAVEGAVGRLPGELDPEAIGGLRGEDGTDHIDVCVG